MDKKLQVRRFRHDDPADHAAWQALLGRARNPTLFHDLLFLAYHPQDRFERHSLVCHRGAELVAALPAAVTRDDLGEPILASPYGASIGGPLLDRSLGSGELRGVVGAFTAYASAERFARMSLRIAPALYEPTSADELTRALSAEGFTLAQSWACHVVEIAGLDAEAILKHMSTSKRHDVRAAHRHGVSVREMTADALPAFLELLDETYARHGVPPTHSHGELADLFRRIPGRIRLILAEHEGRAIAGVLVFVINPTVAYTFYICESAHHAKLCGPAAALAFLFERLASEGFRHVDLGPSGTSTKTNEGVTFFKQGLGGKVFDRQLWELGLS